MIFMTHNRPVKTRQVISRSIPGFATGADIIDLAKCESYIWFAGEWTRTARAVTGRERHGGPATLLCCHPVGKEHER